METTMNFPALHPHCFWSPSVTKTLVVSVLVLSVVFICDSESIECWSYVTINVKNITLRPCFGTLCRCDESKSIADCSSNKGRLLFVPQFPMLVKKLNFSNNGLQNITRDDFFLNVSHVTLLDLYNNRLESFSSAAFLRLHNLTVLLIGGNKFPFPYLTTIFSIPTLRTLDILCGGFRSLPGNTFVNSSLKNLWLSWNSVHDLKMKYLQALSCLTDFRMWHNHLYSLQTARMPCLKYVDLAVNRMFHFPKTCHQDSNESFFPMLRFLNLEYNQISVIKDPVCLPSLRFLYLRYNRFDKYPTGTFSLSRFPSLQYLELLGMQARFRTMSAYAFNNSGLIKIGMSNNNIDFSRDVVDSYAFGGCTNLSQLDLSSNNFQYVSNIRCYRLFKPLKSLQILDLSNTKIEMIQLSSSALHIIQGLYLNQNSIAVLPDGIFDHLPKLEALDLSGNRLSRISSKTFSQRTRERLTHLNLTFNPFRCNCGLIWFSQWLRSNSTLFGSNGNKDYRCDSKVFQTVQSFHLNEQACLLDKDTTFAIICIISVFLILLVIVSIFFRFRWHIRLLLYEAFRHQGSQQRAARHCTYDVFVGYAAEDIQWVTQELLPVIEGQWNLRVCVHQRDFLLGKHIVDNIADCVEESHKMLMVFSPDFARSEWCQFELKYCQSHSMERNDVMVLVILHETSSRAMTPAMLALLRTTTYIQWSEEHDAKSSFWGRMHLAFNDVLQRN